MIDWAAAETLTDDLTATIFDVTACVMKPRRAGASVNHRAIADATRVEFTFMGTIELDPPVHRIARHLSSDPASRQTVAYDAVLTANRADWPWYPVRLDHVAVGDELFEIAAQDSDRSLRGCYYLTKVRV